MSKQLYDPQIIIQPQKSPGNSKIGKKKHATNILNGRLRNNTVKTDDKPCTEPLESLPIEISTTEVDKTPAIEVDDAPPPREDTIWTSTQPEMAEAYNTPKPKRKN